MVTECGTRRRSYGPRRGKMVQDRDATVQDFRPVRFSVRFDGHNFLSVRFSVRFGSVFGSVRLENKSIKTAAKF